MSPKPAPPLCALAPSGCFRHAAVLATDIDQSDPFRYSPVCKVHMRVAITRGLKRSALLPSGYRQPVSILPLEGEPRP